MTVILHKQIHQQPCPVTKIIDILTPKFKKSGASDVLFICDETRQNQVLVATFHLPKIQFQVINRKFKLNFDILVPNYSEARYFFVNETN